MWEPNSGEPWKPSKRQEDFIEIPDTVFEALYGGAAGGGKSELLFMFPLLRGFHEYPHFHGIIFRRTFPQLEASLIKRAVPIYEKVGGKYNESKHVFRFSSGAEMRFSYLDKDSSARDHDTNEYNLCMFDELTSFTEFQYTYLTSRVRTSSNLPAFLRSASNPGNIGHGWVRDRFVKPAPEGGVLLRDNKTKQTRIFVPAKLTDNPYLLKDDPLYASRLEILPEADRRAKLDGDWFMFIGQVYSEFRTMHISTEPENACHVIAPFEIPAWWPRILAIDWGFTAQTYALWIAVSPEGRAVVYREYSITKAPITEWSADIARLSQGENIVSVVIDPSANQDRGFEKTIKAQFMETSGFYETENGDNDRLGGKQLIHEYLRWKPKPKNFLVQGQFDGELAHSILRMHGLAKYKDYLKSFEEEKEETNLPKLQIFLSCPKLIECIPSLIYDEKRVEDVQEYNGDDPYDTLRYGLKRVHRFVEESDSEFSKLKKIEVLEKEKEAGNYTHYARMARQAEREKLSEGLGVSPIYEE